MRCMNCGVELTESVYCPECGCDVSVQRQAIILSGLFYNQGLEKAQVRDLSGSIDQLRRSLKFNKLNIPARNLLGLVYFETGEVVAALSEWVISKNIQPEHNIASDYIDDLQRDVNRLDTINQTIKKYNIALENCGNGNEDVAEIQLKKVLAQNPKLIKGYHLLSLLYLRQGEYEKARKLLKKAIRIDKTNTTTLRFLKEVDEQTGTATQLEPRLSLFGSHGRAAAPPTQEELQEVFEKQNADMNYVPQAVMRDTSVPATLINIIFGALIGAACIWFLFMPARTQKINREANERISVYSSQMAMRGAEYDALQGDLDAANSELERVSGQLAEAETQNAAFADVLKAAAAASDGNYTEAWTVLQDIDISQLGTDARSVYDSTRSDVIRVLLEESLRSGIREFDQGNYAAAIPYFEQARSVSPLDYQTLNYLAHSYRKNGDSEKADEIFREIIKAYPDSAQSAQAESYLGAPADADLPAELAPVEATVVEPPPVVVDVPEDTGDEDGGDGNTGGEDGDTGEEDGQEAEEDWDEEGGNEDDEGGDE